VAERLLGPDRAELHALERELGRELEVRARADLHQEQFELVALDEGPPVPLALPWLGGREVSAPKEIRPEQALLEGARPEETPPEEAGATAESADVPEGISVDPEGPTAAAPDTPSEAVDAEEESLILAPSQETEER
jgi:hypothetical protein